MGRHIVKWVLQSCEGVEVIACDLTLPSRMESAGEERLRRWALDVRDRAACLHVLRETRPTHVLHAAAITDGPENDVVTVNAGGTENVMYAVGKCGSVQRALLVSSSAVYGCSSTDLDCDESHPLQLRSAYARSKRVAELSLAAVERASGIPLLAARLGACYGPGEQVGQFRPRVSLVERLFAALRDGRPVRITGTDYIRDWTHLDEVSGALLSLLQAPHLAHRIYNVSSGVGIAARELIAWFCSIGLEVQWTEDGNADVVLDAADGRKPLVIDRLRADTGFEPCLDWKTGLISLLQGREAQAATPDHALLITSAIAERH